MSCRFKSLVSSFVLSFACASAVAEDPAKLHDAVVPAARGGRQLERHSAMNARIKEGNVDLVFIGDSITQGWEGRGKAVWQKFYGKRNAVNLGIGGDRTQHVIWRLNNGNLEGVTPKAAVIMIGTNNSGRNTPEQIAEGVTAIVRQLQDKTPDTQILLLATFPRGADSGDAKRICNEKSNAIVAKLASAKNVTYLDIGQNFLADDGTLSRDTMPDLLHLNEKSYAIWGRIDRANADKTSRRVTEAAC